MDTRSTAIHEAGHAVKGRVLRLTCGGASIVPNEDEEEAGHSLTADPWETFSHWDQTFMEAIERGEQPLKYRLARSAFRGRIIAYMAGAEAENELLGKCQGGDGDDRKQIEMMAESGHAELPDALWQRYEPRTRRLVRKHRTSIERVAEALQARQTLQPDEIDALIA
jgi:ATP-dependent Zn protease